MLFHGSYHYIQDDYLIPQPCIDGGKCVCMTTDLDYAIIRAGEWDYKNIYVKEEYQVNDDKYHLIELIPGAFDKIFNHIGWIYICEDSEQYVKKGVKNEFRSALPVKITQKICIGNVQNYLESRIEYKNSYEMHKYSENSQDYWGIPNGDGWKNVAGGYAGYIQRRKNRIKNL